MSADIDAPVSVLLERWQSGDEEALKTLIPLVYSELRRLASAQLRRQARPSLQPSELVNEAYLKLAGVKAAD
ncbi:MAG: ECF-type sigma factor, partial [Acidobacteriota bacterium]